MKRKLFLVIICLMFLCFSCSKKQILNEASYDEAYMEEAPQVEYKAMQSSSRQSMSKKDSNDVSAGQIERKLIKIGDINFETENIKESRVLIDGLLIKYGAYINNENESSYERRLEQYLVVKIPKGAFDDFINDLASGVKHINNKHIDIQDVTEEFIDITARLKVKKDAEQTYLRLLNTAKSVRDVLDIQNQIQDLRSEIEAIEGRLRYLEYAVNYSTLNISMYQIISAGNITPTVSFFAKVFSSIKDGLNMFLDVIVAILNLWVFIVLTVVILLLIKWKFFRRKNNEHK
ncbi:MAG: DUF4349 domain-containing protein [Treponema sp.]